MPAPINPPILAKASLVTARVIDKAADTPHAMTNAALAMGSTTHSVIGATNQIFAENFARLEPKGPAKLVSRLLEKIDSSVVSSAMKGQRSAEVFWVPFSDGVTQTGAAVANPFTLIYANKAGYTLPEDATEATALLASIRHPEPYVRWPTAEPAEEPAPKVPDGGEGTPDAPKAPDGEGTPDAPKAPDGQGTPDAPKAPDGEGTPDAPKAPDGEGTPDAPKGPDGQGTPDAPKGPDGEGTPDAPKAPDGEGTPDAPKAPDGDTPAPNGNEGTPGGEVPDAPKAPEGGGTDATIAEAPATNAGVTAGVAPEGSEAPVTDASPAAAAAAAAEAPVTAPAVADAPVTTGAAPAT
ncbi:MAG: Dehydrogenase [Thermoleophilia bacterium]|nr:Dehydrogenase [Thermoleophilia bacterium]